MVLTGYLDQTCSTSVKGDLVPGKAEQEASSGEVSCHQSGRTQLSTVIDIKTLCLKDYLWGQQDSSVHKGSFHTTQPPEFNAQDP